MKNPFTLIFIVLSTSVFLVTGFLEIGHFLNNSKGAHPDHTGLKAGVRFLILLISAITSMVLLVAGTLHYLIKKQKVKLIPIFIALVVLIYDVISIKM